MEILHQTKELTTGSDVRLACRSGTWTGATAGLAQGFAQANLVILPRDWAFDFLLFCQRNPKPCPLITVTEPGSWHPSSAPTADLRTDLPRYRVWQDGKLVDEPTSIENLWRDDLVSFLIGCSFTFESALQRAGIKVRHIDLGRNVPMFRSNIRTFLPRSIWRKCSDVSFQHPLPACRTVLRFPGRFHASDETRRCYSRR